MRLSIILFDGFTALDVVGGYEVLSRVPDLEVEFVAAEPGLIAADTRQLGLAAPIGLSRLVGTDILYVPGGPGVDAMLEDPWFLQQLERLHDSATWTLGICNGVALLGGAGLLKDRKVATNWGWVERMADYGASATGARYEIDGDIVTGAGVSASIDTALELTRIMHGDDMMRLIQLGIEYYPDPPSTVRSAQEASPAERELVLAYEEAVAAPLLSQSPSWQERLVVRERSAS